MSVALFNFKLPSERIHNRKTRFDSTFCHFRSYHEMLNTQCDVYTLCLKKNKTLNSCPQLPQMLTDFQNSFTGRLTDKFATNAY